MSKLAYNVVRAGEKSYKNRGDKGDYSRIWRGSKCVLAETIANKYESNRRDKIFYHVMLGEFELVASFQEI